MINKFILFTANRILKQNVTLDSRVPTSYLLYLIFEKGIALIHGIIVFRRLIPIFLAPGSIIKCKSKIRFGRGLRIGRASYIDALSIEGITCGNNVSIGFCTYICASGSLQNLGKGMIIGNNVGLGSHGFFGCAGGISIGDDTILGNFVSFHSENHNYSGSTIPIRLQGVSRQGISVGCNCWIGAKATILDGAHIGDHSIVAAGAVVCRGEYPAGVILAGVPAKIIKKVKCNPPISS